MTTTLAAPAVRGAAERESRRKPAILFVHGFGSSRKCWARLAELLGGDPRVAERYELAFWDYPTSWVSLNLLGRIPRLAELGRALGNELDGPSYRGRELVLVGHSQGGLVIQSWFAQVLQAGEGHRLRSVRQAIFLATPSLGSTTAMSLRRLVSTLITNPQEVTLRVLDPDVSDIRAVIHERLVAATTDSDLAWRVPVPTTRAWPRCAPATSRSSRPVWPRATPHSARSTSARPSRSRGRS
jgi:pimeloyl-ACP methyl ester carboxylesterase